MNFIVNMGVFLYNRSAAGAGCIISSAEIAVKRWKNGTKHAKAKDKRQRVLEAYAKEREDNATLREARETAERMIKMGKFSLEDIALCVPSIPLDELKKLEADIMQLA